MKELVRPELKHTNFLLTDEAFFFLIDATGGWPQEFRFVSFYHDGPGGNRYCKFTDTPLRTGWWTTVCDRGKYAAWKFKQNMQTRKMKKEQPHDM